MPLFFFADIWLIQFLFYFIGGIFHLFFYVFGNSLVDILIF